MYFWFSKLFRIELKHQDLYSSRPAELYNEALFYKGKLKCGGTGFKSRHLTSFYNFSRNIKKCNALISVLRQSLKYKHTNMQPVRLLVDGTV